MSRRSARQQETEDFLDANPQLIRHTTHIEVVENEQEECEKREVQEKEPIDLQIQNFVFNPYDTSFMAQASIDGDPVPTFNAVLDDDDDMTLVEFVGFPAGEMFASFPFLEPRDIGPMEIVEGPYYPMEYDVLSLTEDGIGVAQFSGGPMMYPYAMVMEGVLPMEPSGNDAALDGEEMIFFEVRSPYGPYGPGMILFDEEMEDPLPEFEMGGKELGIDFEVVAGRGTVQLVLIDFDDYMSDPTMVELSAGGRAPSSRLDAGRIEAEMTGDGAFDGAYIAVTGDLEIVITGVDLSTNFDPFLATT